MGEKPSLLKPEQVQSKLDQPTQTLIEENPWLVTKLLCLRGMKPYFHEPALNSRTGQTPGQIRALLKQQELCRSIQAIEASLVSSLETNDDKDQLAAAALVWRSGYPPTARDFSPDDWVILNTLRDQSQLVSLAYDFVPRYVEDQAGYLSGDLHTFPSAIYGAD